MLFFWKSDLAAFTYSYCCLQMNYLCIWFHFFSAAGLILDIIFLHSRKLWLCLDFPTFPFSTELAGFIKKVRNKNKTSLSGLSIDEIVQRVTEHVLDEERKKKVSVSFKFIIYSTFFLFIYKMWELWDKMLPTKDGEQCSRQCARFEWLNLLPCCTFWPQPSPGKGWRLSAPSSAVAVPRAAQDPPSMPVGASPETRGPRTEDVPVSAVCMTVAFPLFCEERKENSC